MGSMDTWGTDADERCRPFACDALVDAANAKYYRGLTIEASASTVFRWLCQMRVAPYSYDWIDNRGRRSPQSLTSGLDDLAAGQTVMGIFELVDFVPGGYLAFRLKPNAFPSRFGD